MVIKHQTSVSLTKKQLCFLDGISKNCRFSGGRKLRRTSIVRAFLTVGRKLKIDISGVKSEKDLAMRITAAFKDKR